MAGSLIRETPPAARMSAGMRSSAITAHAPASCAIFACSGVVTSMITPPLSIWARLRLSSARFCVMSFPSFRRCLVSRFIIERIGLAHPNQSNLDGANPQLLHPSNPATGCMDLCIRHVFEDARNQWGGISRWCCRRFGLGGLCGRFPCGRFGRGGLSSLRRRAVGPCGVWPNRSGA